MQGKTPITLDTLLNGDRTLFQIRPGDEETPAQLMVAEKNELIVAINVSSERITALYQDLLKAEARIEKLERLLSSSSEALESPV